MPCGWLLAALLASKVGLVAQNLWKGERSGCLLELEPAAWGLNLVAISKVAGVDSICLEIRGHGSFYGVPMGLIVAIGT